MTGRQLQAAKLVGTARLHRSQIAAKVGVTIRTLTTWKSDPDFLAEVRRCQSEWRARSLSIGIADKALRLHNLNNLLARSIGIIHQRARDKWHRQIPGGNTGLLVAREKAIPVSRGHYRATIEYEFDAPLVSGICALMQQAAVEKGEWKDKKDASGAVGGSLEIIVTFVKPGAQTPVDNGGAA